MLQKLLCSLIAFSGGISLFSTPAYGAEETAKSQSMVRIDVKDKNFSIEVPSDWVRDQAREGIDLFMFAPVPAKDAIALTNLGVVAGKVSRHLNLENFYKVNVENLPKAFDNFVQTGEGTGGIPGQSTQWISFTRKLKTGAGELELQELQYYLISGDYGYVITFSATPEEYTINRGIFEKIIGSFKVVETSDVPSVELFK